MEAHAVAKVHDDALRVRRRHEGVRGARPERDDVPHRVHPAANAVLADRPAAEQQQQARHRGERPRAETDEEAGAGCRPVVAQRVQGQRQVALAEVLVRRDDGDEHTERGEHPRADLQVVLQARRPHRDRDPAQPPCRQA